MDIPHFRNNEQWERNRLVEYNHNILSCNTVHLPTYEMFNHELARITSRQLQGIFKYTSQCKKRSECNTKDIINLCQSGIMQAIKNNCSQRLFLAGQGKLSTEGHPDNKIFIEYDKCRKQFEQSVSKHCFDRVDKECSYRKVVAYKALRLTMDNVRDMLLADPDIYVLYLMRDPRAIAASRYARDFSYPERSPVSEAYYLCQKIMQDYTIFQKLKLEFPGALKMVRYEDMVRDKITTAENIYSFIGVKPHHKVFSWIEKNNRVKNNSGATNRVNSVSHIHKWKETVQDINKQNGMTKHCEKVLAVYSID